MKNYFFITILTILLIDQLYAQQQMVDDIVYHKTNELEHISFDSAQIYIQKAELATNIDTFIIYAKKALPHSIKSKSYIQQIKNYNLLACYEYYNYNYINAINYYNLCANISKEINDNITTANSYTNIATCYSHTGLHQQMWEYYNTAIELLKQTKDTFNLVYVYQQLGQTCRQAKMYSSAYEYFYKALNINNATENKLGMAYNMSEIGYTNLMQCLAMCKKETIPWLHKAKRLFLKAKETLEQYNKNDFFTNEIKFNNYRYLEKCYLEIAKHSQKKQYIDSCKYYLNIYQQKTNTLGIKYMQTNLNIDIADCMIFEQNYSNAIKILENTKQNISNDSTNTDRLNISYLLALCYKKIGKLEKSYQEYIEYTNLKDYFNNENIIRQTEKLNYKIKQDKEIKRVESEKIKVKILQEAKMKRQKIITSFSLIGLSLMMVMIIIVLKSLDEKKKINEKLNSKNTQLEQQQQEIYSQNAAIIHANNQTRKSIIYAKRIQQAVMPSLEEINKIFPQLFIIYMPKDLVSGDFYYINQIRESKILIVADCTGHGVPGSLLSMLGITALKEILNKIELANQSIDPKIILEKMRIYVKKSLSNAKEDNNMVIADGMDMTVCIIDSKNMNLQYASANQNSTIIRNKQIIRLKGDSMPIGYFIKETPFNSKNITIITNDMIYIYSDGIKDQNGGIENSKFSLKKLNELLAQYSTLSIDEQKTKIENDIRLWMQNTEQIDDITIIGLKI